MLSEKIALLHKVSRGYKLVKIDDNIWLVRAMEYSQNCKQIISFVHYSPLHYVTERILTCF